MNLLGFVSEPSFRFSVMTFSLLIEILIPSAICSKAVEADVTEWTERTKIYDSLQDPVSKHFFKKYVSNAKSVYIMESIVHSQWYRSELLWLENTLALLILTFPC